MKVVMQGHEYIIPITEYERLESRANLKQETPYLVKVDGYIAPTKVNFKKYFVRKYPERLISRA